MGKTSLSTDIKVGIFTILGLALVTVSILVLGGSRSYFSKQYKFVTYFADVQGLITGAKVVLSGIRVGTIQSIDLDPSKNLIKVELGVEQRYAASVRETTIAEISTQGVLGDKFLGLTNSDPNAPSLADGAEIKNAPPRDMGKFLSGGESLMTSLNQIASSMDRLLKTWEHDHRSDRLFEGLAISASQVAILTKKINEGAITAELAGTLKNMNQILGKINNGTGTLGALVNDPELYYDLRSLMGGANRNRIMRNLIFQTVREGEENKKGPKP